MKDAETRYCASELEVLAIMWALKQYNAILWNQTVYVITDHEALKKLLAVKEPATPKLVRYVEFMSTYGITNDRIIYRPGLKNQAPDALSRYPLLMDPNEKVMDLEDDEVDVVQCQILQGGGDLLSVTNLEALKKSIPDEVKPMVCLEYWDNLRMKQKRRTVCQNRIKCRKERETRKIL